MLLNIISNLVEKYKSYRKKKKLSDLAREVVLFTGKKYIPEEILTRAIGFYEKKGDYCYAGMIAKDAGLLERAVENYDKAGLTATAAEIAEEAGLEQRAKELHEKEIKCFEDEGSFGVAGYIAEEAGMHEKAIEFYERHGDLIRAAGAAKKAGRNEEAIKLYEKQFKAYEAQINNVLYLGGIPAPCGYLAATNLAKEIGMSDRARAYRERDRVMRGLTPEDYSKFEDWLEHLSHCETIF